MANEVQAAEPAKNVNAGKVTVALVIACAIGAYFYFDLGRFLSLDALKENRDRLLAFTEANYAASVALFILVYIAVTGLSLLGALVLTLLCRFLFGSLEASAFFNI